jgi:hypothetical protein
VINRTDEPVRVLMLSTLLKPDIIEYLDSGKISATSPADGRLFRARVGPELEYWDGEYYSISRVVPSAKVTVNADQPLNCSLGSPSQA